jgi:hypothetical protein
MKKPFTIEEQIPLWDAINEYTESCGGNTSGETISDKRMDCVVKVMKVIESLIETRE